MLKFTIPIIPKVEVAPTTLVETSGFIDAKLLLFQHHGQRPTYDTAQSTADTVSALFHHYSHYYS